MKFGRVPTTESTLSGVPIRPQRIVSRVPQAATLAGMASPTDYKQAAIEQWTADPCGSSVAEGEPGSRSYFDRLLEARHEYAPWMRESLGYDDTTGLAVLDVGCGQGIDLYHYAKAGARATGIDLTPRHCELARQHLAVA